MNLEEAATAFMLQGRPPGGLSSRHFTDPDLKAMWVAASGISEPSPALLEERAKTEGIGLNKARMMILEMELPAESPESISQVLLESYTTKKSREICEQFLHGRATPSEVLDVLQMGSKKSTGTPQKWSSLGEAIGSAINRIKEGEEVGIPFPYVSIRPYIGDLSEGNLIVLSGATGSGKTAFAINLALRIADTHRIKMISLEMTKEELAFRAMGILSGVPINSIRHNTVSEDQAVDLARACREAEELHLEFDDAPSANIDYIEKVMREDPPDLLLVDHLHLMSGASGSRTADIGDMARRFKLLAMELGIPILLLAQLRKVPAGERVKEPGLDDLRDSAEIQQSANAVMFVHQEQKEDPDLIRVLIKKNRSGPLGDVDLTWRPQLTRMDDPSEFLQLASPAS